MNPPSCPRPRIPFFSIITCVWFFLAVALCRADAVKPPASGLLFDETAADAGSQLKGNAGVTSSIVDQNGKKVIKVDFSELKGYPGIDFPVPDGGWDLSDFTGAKIEATNSGTEPVTVNLKTDNAGDSKDQPWNIEMTTLDPGQTKILKLTFGVSFNQPGFKLDPAHVTAIKAYIVPPKSPASILLSGLKAYKEAEEGVGPLPEPTPIPPAPPNAARLRTHSRSRPQRQARFPRSPHHHRRCRHPAQGPLHPRGIPGLA